MTDPAPTPRPLGDPPPGFVAVPGGWAPVGSPAPDRSTTPDAAGRPVPRDPAFVPAPRRPPLPRRQRTRAFVAGAIALNLLAFSGAVVAVTLGLLVFGGLFTWLFRNIDDWQTSASSPSIEEIRRFLDSGVVEFGIVLGLVALVVAIIVAIAALLISVAVLRGGGHPRPWPVTWSGVGIAVAAVLTVGWLALVLAQVVTALVLGVVPDPVVGLVVAASITLAVSIVVNGVLGALAWWWMAWAFRAPDGSASSAGGPAERAPAERGDVPPRS